MSLLSAGTSTALKSALRETEVQLGSPTQSLPAVTSVLDDITLQNGDPLTVEEADSVVPTQAHYHLADYKRSRAQAQGF